MEGFDKMTKEEDPFDPDSVAQSLSSITRAVTLYVETTLVFCK